MVADTLPSCNDLSRGEKAGTCFSLCPPYETFIQSVSVQLTAIIPVAILMYILGMLFRCCFWSRIHLNPKNRRRTNLGSHIWSRRRILWRHARVSRVSYIALAMKSRCCDNFKYTVTQQNVHDCLEPRQQSVFAQWEDVGLVYTSDESGNGINCSEFTVGFVPLFLPFLSALGILALYNEEKLHDFTLGKFEKSSFEGDPTDNYANNSILLGTGPYFEGDPTAYANNSILLGTGP